MFFSITAEVPQQQLDDAEVDDEDLSTNESSNNSQSRSRSRGRPPTKAQGISVISGETK